MNWLRWGLDGSAAEAEPAATETSSPVALAARLLPELAADPEAEALAVSALGQTPTTIIDPALYVREQAHWGRWYQRVAQNPADAIHVERPPRMDDVVIPTKVGHVRPWIVTEVHGRNVYITDPAGLEQGKKYRAEFLIVLDRPALEEVQAA